jgi:hypothetical protein
VFWRARSHFFFRGLGTKSNAANGIADWITWRAGDLEQKRTSLAFQNPLQNQHPLQFRL